MVGAGYLLETSVLTRLRTPVVVNRVRQLRATAPIARATISDLEIGFSARNGAEWDRLRAGLTVLAPIECETLQRHLDRARDVQRQLAAQGLAGRKVPDLIIAAVAEAARMTVVHYDADFDLIAAVTGQPAEWVTERGSID